MIETRWPLNGNMFPAMEDQLWELIVHLGQIIARQDRQLKDHAAQIMALQERGMFSGPQFDQTPMSNGDTLRHHARGECRGDCCLHGTSTSSLCRWPMAWRRDRRILEHRCFHGVGHPCHSTVGDTTHGCCAGRCCSDG